MKIELLLHHIKGKEKTIMKNKRLHLQVKLGEDISFNSGSVLPQKNAYTFLERNTIQIEDRQMEYMRVELMDDRKCIAHKTIFIHQAVENHTLDLKASEEEESHWKLSYRLEIQTDDHVKAPRLRKVTSIDEQPAHLSSEEGKLELWKMGILMYNFAQRLDPALEIYHSTRSLLLWNKPWVTFLFGVILSFAILYPTASVFFLSLFLMFGRQIFISHIQAYQRKKDVSKRVILPKENMVFLQQAMENYCKVFEAINNFLRNEDKADFFDIIKYLSRFGFFMMALGLIFPTNILLVLMLWSILLMFSKQRKAIIDLIQPGFLKLNCIFDRFTNKMQQIGVGKIISLYEVPSYTIVKELYIYEYQRWWVGKEWVASHWSDESRELVLLARKDPPKGWTWMEAWTFSPEHNTDEEAFEYCNDIVPDYSPSRSLKTIRRRKWTRRCVKSIDLPKTPKDTSLQILSSK